MFCFSGLDGFILVCFLTLNLWGKTSFHPFQCYRLSTCFIMLLLITLEITHTQMPFPKFRKKGLYVVV